MKFGANLMKLSGYFRQHVTNMTLKYVKILSLRTGNMDENQLFAHYVVMFEPGNSNFWCKN